MATESQYKTTYNIALLNLSESKGTLLADRDIVIVEDLGPLGTLIANEKGDQQSESRSKGVARENTATPVAVATPLVPQPIASPKSATDPVTNVAPPSPISGPIASSKTATDSVSDRAVSTGKTPLKVWNFSFSIGGDRPILIKGTISEGTADGP